MELTLKKIETFSKNSSAEDFEADVLIDGCLAGIVYNRGDDHLHTVHWVHNKALGQAFDAWLDKEVMPVENGDGKITLLETIEDKITHLITVILDTIDEKKVFKKMCRGRTVFRLKGDKVGSWRSVKSAWNAATKAWLTTRYGNEIEEIANETRI